LRWECQSDFYGERIRPVRELGASTASGGPVGRLYIPGGAPETEVRHSPLSLSSRPPPTYHLRPLQLMRAGTVDNISCCRTGPVSACMSMPLPSTSGVTMLSHITSLAPKVPATTPLCLNGDNGAHHRQPPSDDDDR
jgi:hypothetical protein